MDSETAVPQRSQFVGFIGSSGEGSLQLYICLSACLLSCVCYLAEQVLRTKAGGKYIYVCSLRLHSPHACRLDDISDQVFGNLF